MNFYFLLNNSRKINYFIIVANSLRDMWNRKQQEKRAPEFDGRAEYPPPRQIPLYVNLNTKTSLANSSGIPSIPTTNVSDKI